MDKRILCISDIHGQYGEFCKLLDIIKYDNTKDTLILLGDYVDRGDQNLKTIYKVKELVSNGAIALRGNHDEMMATCIKSILEKPKDESIIYSWIYCGGYNTYHEISNLSTEKLRELYYFTMSLPLVYVIDDFIFIHAGVNSNLPLNKNTKEDALWIRDKFIRLKAYDNKVVIFGHTPTKYMHGEHKIWYDKTYNDKIGIDCGSVFGGKLACLELPSMKEYYI